MCSPDPLPLADGASGRMSMPFLPTLAVAAALAAATLLCPTPRDAPADRGPAAVEIRPHAVRAAEPVAPARAPSLSVAAPSAAPDATVAVRVPATLAFAALYPVTADATAVRPAVVPRATHRLATAVRACPGRRCPGAPREPIAVAVHAAQAGPGAEAPASDEPIPAQALPFAEVVAETFAPALRAAGEAADLVRGGAAAVRGAVSGSVAGSLALAGGMP